MSDQAIAHQIPVNGARGSHCSNPRTARPLLRSDSSKSRYWRADSLRGQGYRDYRRRRWTFNRVTTNAVISEGIPTAIALETGVASLGNMEAV